LRDSLLFESTDGPKAGQTGWGADPSGGPATGFGGWLDGYGVFGSVDQSINAPGFDYQVYGAAAGADYSFQQPFLLGASLAYARTELDGYTGLNASGGGDTVRGSLYTAYAQPDLAAYASLQLSYAWSDFDEERRIQFGSLNQNAKGSYTGNEFSTYAELGTRAFELGADIRLRPFIGVGYGYFEREGFDESGGPTGANLSVDSQSYQSLDLAVGATIDQVIDLGPRLRLRTELRARYDHEFLDTNPKLNARISGQPFEVAGVSVGRDIGLVGLGVEFIDAGGLSTFLGYDARFNTEFVEHNATIGILVRF
jgi:outer membrane autotransporter protein